MTRWLIALAIAALATAAMAQIAVGPDTYNNQKILPIGRGSFAPLGPGSASGGSGPPPPSFAIQLENTSANITLEDGVTTMCLEGHSSC